MAANDRRSAAAARARLALVRDDPPVPIIANTLAAALLAVGETGAAEQLSEDTLVQARNTFGEDHPHTRKAADTLAAARHLQRGAHSPPTSHQSGV